MGKPALGKGLGALISGGVKSPATGSTKATAVVAPPAAPAEKPPGEEILFLAVDRIVTSPFQPRQVFASEPLNELVESIRERGVVQPLIVRKVGDTYELIAGERRWRASREAGLHQVPVIVREASDRDALELALIENLQRENLSPIEEARAYQQLIEQFSLTQEQVAQRVGKNRTTVANSLRLLQLSPQLCAYLEKGQLSVGHAKVLLGLASQQQDLAAEVVLRQGLNVRETEKLAEKMKAGVAASTRVTRLSGSVLPVDKPASIRAVEEKLREKFGTQVFIVLGKKKGKIEIEYYSKDDLDRLLDLLGLEEL